MITTTTKKKYYQSFQGTLREAARDYQRQTQDFDSGFLSLSPDLRGDFEKVWRERTLARVWSELSAPRGSGSTCTTRCTRE